MRIFGAKERREAKDQGPPPGDLGGVLGRASERIDTVVDVAGRAADEVRTDLDHLVAPDGADVPAGASTRINRERIVKELVESVVRRADALRREAEALSRLLERAAVQFERMQSQTQSSPVQPPNGPQPENGAESSAPAVARQVAERLRAGSRPKIERTERPRPAKSPSQVPDGVRMLATQMVVAGSAPEEIERRLRREFGVEDPSTVLDEVFGRRVSG